MPHDPPGGLRGDPRQYQGVATGASPLESPNQSPNLGSPVEADVVQVHEFAARHPPQVAKAAEAGPEQGPQHDWLEADVVSGQVVGIIEPDNRSSNAHESALRYYLRMDNIASDRRHLSGTRTRRVRSTGKTAATRTDFEGTSKTAAASAAQPVTAPRKRRHLSSSQEAHDGNTAQEVGSVSQREGAV